MKNESIMRRVACLLLNKNPYAVAYWEALKGRAEGKIKDVWVKIARLELYNYMHVW